MAKTVKIKTAGTYDYEITNKTADTTYVFSNETVASGSTLNFLPVNYYENLIYARKDNDLFIYANFRDDSKYPYTYKTSVTTIKDYFSYCDDNNGLVCVEDYNIYSQAQYDAYDYAKKSFEDATDGGYVLGDKGSTKYTLSNTDTARTRIVEAGGSDKYTVDHLAPTTAPIWVEDMGGNDKYDITNSKGLYVQDYMGNDKYTVTNCEELAPVSGENWESDSNLKGDLYICDYAGNDTYKFDNVKTTNDNYIYTYDEMGNDKYVVNNVLKFELDDYYGNDKYAVSNAVDIYIESDNGNDTYAIKDSRNIEIYDEEEYFYDYYHESYPQYASKAKDKYTVTNCSHLDIYDEYGNDKYNLTNINTYLYLYDEEYGNDTYTINGAHLDLYNNGGHYEINSYLYDEDGTETYKLTDVANLSMTDYYGNDTYTIKDSDNLYIYNSYGNEKYTIKNSSNIELHDGCGKDVYTVSGTSKNYAENVTIRDSYSSSSDPKGNNDKYNLSYIRNESSLGDWSIYDEGGENAYNIKFSEGISIKSESTEGKDSYNINSCKDVYIYDAGTQSSDDYTVKLAHGGVTIKDNGGDSDSLKISNLNNKNIIFMSNYNGNDTGVDSNNSLIMFDTKTRSFVQICDVYTRVGDDYSTTDFYDGLIETVKAGKKSVDITDSDMITKLNDVRAQVVSWLGEDTSVVDVLNSNNQEQIDALVLKFTNVNS